MKRAPAWGLIPLGLSLCAAHLGLSLLLRHAGSNPGPEATWVAILTLLIAGTIWMYAVTRGHGGTIPITGLTLLMGVLMRLMYFGGPAFHEADFNRYLWDGAVVAQGGNPYAKAPAEARVQRVARSIAEITDSASSPERWALADLSDQAGPVFDEIRYADIRTIYPPLSQLGFVAAHWLKPFSLDAWRLIVLVTELITLGMLLSMLKSSGQTLRLALVYWWNPLLIVQFAASGHMDALIQPPLLASLWALWRGRNWVASTLVSIAAAIKIWPLMLLLLTTQKQWHWWRITLVFGIGTTLALLLLWPQLQYLGQDQDGLALFATHWQRNALAFPALAEKLSLLLPPPAADMAARLLVLALVLGVVFRMWRENSNSLGGQARRLAWPIAALLLLAPTAYPWYYAWLLPLLVFWPHPAFLLMGVLMALYYAGFALKPANGPEHWPVWLRSIEFLPVWVWLGYGFVQRRRQRMPP